MGFRPFIFNLASRFGIHGTVANTGIGVVIRATGPEAELTAFIGAITEQAPPLAQINSLEYQVLPRPLRAKRFEIIASSANSQTETAIPPDVAVCDDCLRELDDPEDFRHRYPFINCTNCGPRFTITEHIPYDRPQTSMKVFPMCPVCTSEYGDPTNRRFHAQPNACPSCGPRLTYHDQNGTRLAVEDVVVAAAADLKTGKILALRGLGGFHLGVDAGSESAVENLRIRKNRPEKPLAVMVSDLEAAASIAQLSDRESELLSSAQRPIVLLQLRQDAALAPNISPHLTDIGLMLPYTPLHHLLFRQTDCPPALVMTSGNLSGAPICTANQEALEKLGTIADRFLLHNREIVTRVDDSVIKFIGDSPRSFRRARGYVPSPIEIPYELPPVIGCGGGLKSTFSLASGTRIFPSQHIGDLFNLASLNFYRESVENLQRVFRIEPIAAACDLHPDYLSSRFARELGLPLYPVQHHHAHAVAVMAEHGLSEPVLAVVLDGTGYGTDGTIWGGEFLETTCTGFTRLGCLEPLPLPGGDAAAREPWRLGLAALHRLQGSAAAETKLFPQIDPDRRQIVIQMLENGFNTPSSSSCGRLFDAVAALLGLSLESSFEGQAAMGLEAAASRSMTADWKDKLLESLRIDATEPVPQNDGGWQIICSEIIEKIVYDRRSGKNRSDSALAFHFWLIGRISRLVEILCTATGNRRVVLAGGCLQNAILLEGLLHTLNSLGFEPYTGSRIPVNDGGISVGQAVIGGLRHVSGSTDES